MPRGDMKRGVPVEGSPNSPTWKGRAEELEAQLDDAEARLSEIADIADPERAQADERIVRLEKMTVILLAALRNAGAVPKDLEADADELLGGLVVVAKPTE